MHYRIYEIGFLCVDLAVLEFGIELIASHPPISVSQKVGCVFCVSVSVCVLCGGTQIQA